MENTAREAAIQVKLEASARYIPEASSKAERDFTWVGMGIIAKVAFWIKMDRDRFLGRGT
jgi:hypothetical protein